MRDSVLDGLRIAVLAADGFEQLELTRPTKAMEKHGAQVEIVSLRPGSIQGMNLLAPGKKVDVDRTLFTADAARYHGLFIPGGYINPDTLRQSDDALEFVQAFEAAGKPIATICHAPWVLISAGLVRNRRLTSWPGIKDDVRNAGGQWVDRAVAHDANWVSSRGPEDLPQFDRAIVEHFAAFAGREAPGRLREVGWGGLLVGTAAVAAAGLAAQRVRQRRGTGGAADAGSAPAGELGDARGAAPGWESREVEEGLGIGR